MQVTISKRKIKNGFSISPKDQLEADLGEGIIINIKNYNEKCLYVKSN